MPAIYHVKVVDDSFDGPVQHIIEAKPNDAVVWHCEEADENFDGAIFHVKWAAANFDGPVWRVLGIARAITVVVYGTSPLTLPDAIADSLSYVKAFGGTEQRNIPQPYTQVNYVTNTAQTAVDTGIMINFAKNYEFEVECRAVSGSWYILQSRATSSGNITGIHGATSGSTITLVVGNVTVCTSAITRAVGNKLYVKATLNAGTATLYVKDETANTEDTQTGSYGTSQPNPTATVYLLGNAGGQYVDVNSDIYMARIKENDTVVMDYVPARQVATAGFYDTVSGTFKTAETPANLSADGNTVPTPDAPMDIVSNNGVLKARHQSGLPLGYTLLESIASSGTQAINTGIKYTGNHFEVEWEAKDNDTAQSTLFACTSASPYSGGLFGTKSDRKYYVGNGSGMIVNYSSADNAFHKWKIVVSDQTATLYKDGTQIGTASITGTIDTTHNIYLFCGGWLNANTPTLTQFANWNLKYWKLTDNGVVVFNGIPAKDANNTVGLYDTISETFKTNAGTGDFTAGTAVSDPVEIYTDGTVETINVHGKNLFDINNVTIQANTSIGSDGSLTPNVATKVCMTYLPVKPNTTYTISGDVLGSATAFFRLVQYKSDKTFLGRSADSTGQRSSYTFTTGADTYFVRFHCITEANLNTYQLELGSTATAYQPYYNGGTATAEMLLKVGNYQDVQSIIDGVVTRKVGIKVLDGTEGWTQSAATNNLFYATISNSSTDNTYIPISSHFQGVVASTGYATMTNGQVKHGSGTNSWYFKNTDCANATAFSQYLADQYAAGTPVIVVYPLATPTTESVTGQTLQVTDGDNVLEITQASLNGLELEAQYQAAVSLTIQEVQDANLDPNVEVTIN